MYETPELECYGNFRELTKGGGGIDTDPFSQDPLNNTCGPVAGGFPCLFVS